MLDALVEEPQNLHMDVVRRHEGTRVRTHARIYATWLDCLGGALPCVRHEATWAGVVARNWLQSAPLYRTSQSALSQRRQFASESDCGGPGVASLRAVRRCLYAATG